MFENIIGNQKIKEILKQSIKCNRVSHSYMFVGREGIGKKLFANDLAQTILCLDDQSKKNGTYCGKCKSCIEFSSNNNPDIIKIIPEDTKIKIDQIRNMQLKVSEKPIISKNKVYIIDDADTMTQEAQNCLLKTLEEPPEYVTIILIGSNENNFLATIKSRCTQIYFEKISNEEIKKYLEFSQKNISITDELLQMANGSIKKIWDILENMELYEQISKIINNIDKYDIIDILNMSNILYKSKDNIFEILENMNIIILEKSKQNSKFARCVKIIEDTKKRLKANSNYDMCIDYLLFNMWREIN